MLPDFFASAARLVNASVFFGFSCKARSPPLLSAGKQEPFELAAPEAEPSAAADPASAPPPVEAEVFLLEPEAHKLEAEAPELEPEVLLLPLPLLSAPLPAAPFGLLP